MSSVAKYAIQGFLYQFNKSLLEILSADDETDVTFEGIVEDIDLTSVDGGIEAVQCKYHESRENFSPSLIHKPLLQMMKHFVSSGHCNVRYKIYIHVPGDRPSPRSVSLCEIDSALNSTRFKKLNKAIDSAEFDRQAFQCVCALEFGPSLDELRAEVMGAFKLTSLPEDSIESLYYPNSIDLIATSSTRDSVSCRTFKKPRFLKILADIRKTAISRWTLALKTRDKILRTRKSQLKANLSKNSRKRCLIIAEDTLAEFDKRIVLFIQDFCN